MATSKKSTGKKWKNPMSFAEGTPVNLSVRQVSGEVKKIRATCGLGLSKPLANYDPDTQSWKMYGDISLWGDCPLLVNLPPSGMTRSGVLFLQPAWEPITGETELSSWPTPTTQDHIERKSTQQKPGSMHSVGLGDAVRMWATPTARDHKGAAGYKKESRNLADLTYQAQIMDGHRQWPTPTASDWKGRGPNSKQQGLPEVVKKNPYPTPTYGKLAGGTGGYNQIQKLYLEGQVTDEERKSMQAGNGGSLNPTWVEWLMGFPSGWTDLED